MSEKAVGEEHQRGGSGRKYLEEVDKDEITIRFLQEIYDERSILKKVHEKYPVDKGHKKLENDN